MPPDPAAARPRTLEAAPERPIDSATDSASTKRKPWRRRLALGCLAPLVLFALLLVGFEWYLRAYTPAALGPASDLLGMFESDGDRSIRSVPGWRGEPTIEGRATPVTINNLGMRGADIGPKEPGERRVLVIGDSITFGYGVVDDEAYPAVLERLLRQRSPTKVTVGNAAAPGLGPRDYVSTLRRVEESFAPDLVLVALYPGNDFTDDCIVHKTVVAGYRLEGPMARLAQRSLRARIALRFRTAMVVEKALATFMPSLALDPFEVDMTPEEAEAWDLFPPKPQQMCGLFMDVDADTPLVQKAMRRLEASLVAIRDLAAPTPVLVVDVPSPGHVSETAYAELRDKQGWPAESYRLGTVQRRISALCQRIGVEAFDLTPRFWEQPDGARQDDWIPVNLHFSVTGCRKVAEWLAPRVQELLDSVR